LSSSNPAVFAGKALCAHAELATSVALLRADEKPDLLQVLLSDGSSSNRPAQDLLCVNPDSQQRLHGLDVPSSASEPCKQWHTQQAVFVDGFKSRRSCFPKLHHLVPDKQQTVGRPT